MHWIIDISGKSDRTAVSSEFGYSNRALLPTLVRRCPLLVFSINEIKVDLIKAGLQICYFATVAWNGKHAFTAGLI